MKTARKPSLSFLRSDVALASPPAGSQASCLRSQQERDAPKTAAETAALHGLHPRGPRVDGDSSASPQNDRGRGSR